MDNAPGLGALTALLLFMVASVWLGTLAQRTVERSSFLQGYFLGNRGLGAWAVALTATVQSGGTFMGFPALIYTHGWIVALWIAGYMVVPLTGFGVLGKRLAQLSRRTGAITVPDLFRERFDSPAAGLVASVLILCFMTVMLVPQFKAGAIVMQLCWPGNLLWELTEDPAAARDLAYYLGLAIFTVFVVGYTLIGGFLAAVWTDLFQSVLMLVGVLLLLVLALPAAGGLEAATRTAMADLGPGGAAFAFGPGHDAGGREFLPIGLAFSIFLTWVFAGLGAPAGMVRIMACKDTETMRRSIFLLGVYNALIYIPLLMIFISARAILPGLEKADEVMPRMALGMTRELPAGSFLAGLILAAPFGAVMATVSSYLVVIASGLVRDIYLRFLHPTASEKAIRVTSYLAMVGVGAVALSANIRPVEYLQVLVVFSGACGAAAFVVPALLAAFWRRATAAGAIAAMLAGVGVLVVLFVQGWWLGRQGFDPGIGPRSGFRPHFLLGVEPICWAMLASLLAGVVVSWRTRPPSSDRVASFFETTP